MTKYRAKPTELDGIKFASKGEAGRYAELAALLKGGVISDLVTHPRFPLVVNGVKVGTYIADFSYVDEGARVVEDFKGMRKGAAWAMFRLKAKLVKALYEIDVEVVS